MDEISNEIRETMFTNLKSRLQDFYNNNVNVNPDLVKKKQYFYDWFNEKVTKEDLEITKVNFNRFTSNIVVQIKFFWSFGSNSYSKYQYKDFNVHAMFMDDKYLAEQFSDTYYYDNAKTKALPKDFLKIVEERAKKALKSADNDAIFDSCRLVSQESAELIEDSYYLAKLKYTYPKPDKNGNSEKELLISLWDDSFMMNDVEDYPKSGGGCYIATAVYGSYNCKPVWTLRRYRDETLGSTWHGRLFIKTYYLISPTVVKWFGKTKWFNRMWKNLLDKKVKKLNDEGVLDTPYEDKDW